MSKVIDKNKCTGEEVDVLLVLDSLMDEVDTIGGTERANLLRHHLEESIMDMKKRIEEEIMVEEIKSEKPELKSRIENISMTGYCLFQLSRPEDKVIGAVSTTMPIDIAEYLCYLVDEDQKKK